MKKRTALLLCSALLVGMPGGVAHAQSNAAAEALFIEGRDLLDKQRFAEAADRFNRSQQLDPAVGTLLNLGDAYERMNKTASAWTAYREAVGLAERMSDARRATLARGNAARVEPKLAKLTIETTSETTPTVVVTRGGTKVDPAVFNIPVPVDPGKQVIEASAPGYARWTSSIDAKEAKVVTIRIPKLEESKDMVVAPTTSSGASTRKKAAIGLEIGGGLVLAAGLVFGGLALSRWSTVTDTCPDAKCANQRDLQAQNSDADSATTLSTISTVVSITGLAALAVGIILHVTDKPASSANPPQQAAWWH